MADLSASAADDTALSDDGAPQSDLTVSAADDTALSDDAAAEFRVTVNGLDMATATWARVMAAVRGLYPQVANLSDAAAVQAVMKNVVTEWVATWEARQKPDPQESANQAMRRANEERAVAHEKARRELAEDVRPTVET
jgi:hypothetical protein